MSHRTPAQLSPSANSGAAAATLSMRSSTPPCPGNSVPLSLTPAVRLNMLTVRSPTTESAATPRQNGTSTAKFGIDLERAQHNQQHDREQAADHALPGLARADLRRQLHAAQRLAGRNRHRCPRPRRSTARTAAGPGPPRTAAARPNTAAPAPARRPASAAAAQSASERRTSTAMRSPTRQGCRSGLLRRNGASHVAIAAISSADQQHVGRAQRHVVRRQECGPFPGARQQQSADDTPAQRAAA